jgi:NAD(P)H-hydrate epimerase
MGPAGDFVGEVVVADIGIPDDLADSVEIEIATSRMISDRLPQRPGNANKGTFGKGLIVAGSVNYTGAACLAASAATHIGAGLITLGIPRVLHASVAAQLSEVTYLLLPHDMGVISPDAVDLILTSGQDYDALLLGPGLTTEKEAVTFVHTLLSLEPVHGKSQIGFLRTDMGRSEQFELPPLVLDADGLNALSHFEAWWESLPANSILTPHPGEMARLLDCSVSDVEADRLKTAQNAARDWNQIVVLKGAYTIVADPTGSVVVSPFANPALATAGTGDVLSGAISGLLAQGLSPWDSAVAGVYLHGLSGELVRHKIGIAGAVASDVVEQLPVSMRLLRGQ